MDYDSWKLMTPEEDALYNATCYIFDGEMESEYEEE